ncbi:PVC-type heme-binding CxxCH protein [Robiginitalea biformata]|uniref:PVC-type heme-binding CxxCH protein n=1 Tax=Robiginitalea biformata TaxID=252307 RepID=UPI003B5C6E1A
MSHPFRRIIIPILVISTLAVLSGCFRWDQDPVVPVRQGQSIVFLGNNLPSRMMHYGYFEATLQAAYPDSLLQIRNMGDGGNTPGFRPHSGRMHPWAFPEAEALLGELYPPSGSEGHLESPDEWLARLRADVILAFFGFNEVFRPDSYREITRDELRAFISHTRSQLYNGASPPRLVLLSPTAMEAVTGGPDLPDFQETNKKLEAYTAMMETVAVEAGVPFLDLFHPSKEWFEGEENLTIDGLQLNDAGYRQLSAYLAGQLFGVDAGVPEDEALLAAVREKNWFWHNDFKIPNGVHVFGRRYDPFGPDNYPYELEKIRQMTAVRDTAIWKTAAGGSYDVAAADSLTRPLPPVQSNYKPDQYGHGGGEYLYGEEALATFTLPPGYEISLFASESDFPELANPVQLSFDDAVRLWVATMPSYPHYRPGDSKPDDKLLILEDLDGDGRADTAKTWVDGLHLPVGFELSPEGVYISQGTHLKRYRDTDGDDRADTEEIVFSGFDDHDTHHAISAFTSDPSGAIYMGEGTFLHTNVETPYGPVRGTNGGFYRYNPTRRHLERTAQLPIPNPWGIAFDRWGQPFFLDTSGPALRWMLPGTLQPEYGISHPLPADMVPDAHKVRPTSGLEFVSSRHFPDSVQGDILLCNDIGFLGIKQHALRETGTGFSLEFRQDLLRSSDPNFRPVDLEFAPDGSLYVVDWHNILIGHMQHNARDPYRDHSHGRIYRITHTERPLLSAPDLQAAPVEELVRALGAPEYRTRYRARRVLRGRDPDAVSEALRNWTARLNPAHPEAEHQLLEALWTSWGIGRLDTALLRELLDSEDPRVRAAGVRAVRYNTHLLPDHVKILETTAGDPHGRVRMETLAAASWLPDSTARNILQILGESGLDSWNREAFLAVSNRLYGERQSDVEDKGPPVPDGFSERDSTLFVSGREIYLREGYCATCHQEDGQGLPASGFPPLANSSWATGSQERLIKLTLKGLQGPLMVNAVQYDGKVPMTAFEGLLSDEEIAAVLTYVRNAFGNRAKPVYPESVGRIREAVREKKGFYHTEELQ